MGTSAGLRQAMPEQRSFVLSRAGFAGIQRYAANWLGDNQSRWDHLWLSMPMGMGCGLSGQPFVGADIGGFQGKLERRAVSPVDAIRHAHAVLPKPLRDRQCRPIRLVMGRSSEELVRAAIRLRYRLHALSLRLIPARRRNRRAYPATVGVRLPVRPDRPRHRRPVPARMPISSLRRSRPVARPRRHVYLRVDAGTTGTRAMRSAAVSLCSSRRRWIGFPLYARGGAVIPMWPEAPPSTDYHRRRWNYISSCLTETASIERSSRKTTV